MPLGILDLFVMLADVTSLLGMLFRDKEPLGEDDKQRLLEGMLFVFTADARLAKSEIRYLLDNDDWMPAAERDELRELIDAIHQTLQELDADGRARWAAEWAERIPEDSAVREETLIALAAAAAVDEAGARTQRPAYEQLAALLEGDVAEIDLMVRARFPDG